MAGLAIAAAAMLVGCREEPVPESARKTPAAQAIAPAVAPAPVPVAQASPEPPLPSFTPPIAADALPPTSATPSPTPTPAAPQRTWAASYPPRDECAGLPGFAAFRDKLFAAVRTRDVEALAALADPAIRLDFGGGAGTDELKRRLAAPDGRLWAELADLAPLGCATDKGLATLPWIFARLPDDADGYTAMWVVGTQVPLRDKPAIRGKALRRLDWALVELAGDGFDPRARYTEVRAGADRGYVATAKLRSAIDYRLIAERRDDAWRIAAFVAGD